MVSRYSLCGRAIKLTLDIEQSKQPYIHCILNIKLSNTNNEMKMIVIIESELTLAPIWLPHCPAWMCTISLMLISGLSSLLNKLEHLLRSPFLVWDSLVTRIRSLKYFKSP